MKREEKTGSYAFGVDVGGTTVKIGFFDRSGILVEKWEIPTARENDGATVLPDIADSIRTKIEEHRITVDQIEGIGIGVPGPVDETGYMPIGAVNLGWKAFNIIEALEGYLGLPVKATNDGNAAALGEMWQGSGKGSEHLIMVTLGTGVGAGVIVSGRLVSGFFGGAGEIGHIHVNDAETEYCGCGKKGCLEQYASATGITRLARRRLERDNAPSILRSMELSAKEVFDGVKAGDSVAEEIAEEFGDYLGKGLAAVAAVTNPEVFVLGGGVSKAGEILVKYIRPAFEKAIFKGGEGTEIRLASLGNDAGIYGAAGLFLAKREEFTS